MDTIPIKRIDKLTNDEFLESYRNKRPVIINGKARIWQPNVRFSSRNNFDLIIKIY